MKISLCFLCFLIYTAVFCQEEQQKEQNKSHHSLGFSIGINDFHFRDEYLSPHIFSKTMFSSAISYQLKTKKYLHNFDMTFSKGQLNSAIQPRNISENLGSAAYSISKVFDMEHIAGKPLILSLGAGVSTFLSNTDFTAEDKRYSYEWTEQSWYCSNSLNLHLNGEYQLSKKTNFSMRFTLPLLYFVSRPENGHIFNAENTKVIDHFLNFEFQGKPESIWNDLALSCELSYKKQLGNHCNIMLNYIFNYMQSDRPAPLQMYMNCILFGFEFLY